MTLDANLSCDGGYAYHFVHPPPDRVVCSICYYPSRNPSLTECCGYVMCKVCGDKISKDNKKCPVCKKDSFVIFSNKQMDREVRSLHVYCTNKEKGCKWEGEINDITQHLEKHDGCQFEEVKCYNKCGKLKERRYLANHMQKKCQRRKVQCTYCGNQIERQLMEDHHSKKCLEFPESCPNKCGDEIILRKDMPAHRKECLLETIPCEYENVGCDRVMKRKKRKNHERKNVQEHLRMTQLKLIKTDDRVKNLELIVYQLMNKYSNSAVTDCNCGEMPTVAQWSLNLAAMAALSQSNTNICPVILKISANLDEGSPGVNYIDESSTESSSDSSTESDSSIDSFPCSQAAVHYSNYFYTAVGGYKMCLQVDIAEDEDEGGKPYLSVYCNFMKDSSNDELTWPPRETVKITLLNQISNSVHYSRQVMCEDDDNDASTKYSVGYRKFISTSSLHSISASCCYVQSDLMYFQVCML